MIRAPVLHVLLDAQPAYCIQLPEGLLLLQLALLPLGHSNARFKLNTPMPTLLCACCTLDTWLSVACMRMSPRVALYNLIAMRDGYATTQNMCWPCKL
jgi:hypothetical protein